MAKLMEPCFSAEAHGRVGSIVYRTHRGAAIASAKAAPHSGHTGPMNDRLRYLITAARDWRGLSLRQRYGWAFYARHARHGDPSFPWKEATGFMIFVSCAVHLYMVTHPPHNNPPSRPNLGTLNSIDADQFGTDIRLFYTYSTLPNPGLLSIQVNLAGPYTFGRNARIKDSKLVGHSPVNSNILVETTGQPGRYTLFARLIDSQGLASPWLRTTIDMERA